MGHFHFCGRSVLFPIPAGRRIPSPGHRQVLAGFAGHTPRTRTSMRVLTHATECHRCGQPGQQHGRRMPSLSSEHTRSTCCRLVSSFLTEMVQQIHSLRARGVMSSQAASAFGSDVSVFRRSTGSLWTTPSEIWTVVIEPSRKLKDQASPTRVQLLILKLSSPIRQQPNRRLRVTDYSGIIVIGIGDREEASIDLDLRNSQPGSYFLSTTHEQDQALHYYPLQIK